MFIVTTVNDYPSVASHDAYSRTWCDESVCCDSYRRGLDFWLFILIFPTPRCNFWHFTLKSTRLQSSYPQDGVHIPGIIICGLIMTPQHFNTLFTKLSQPQTPLLVNSGTSVTSEWLDFGRVSVGWLLIWREPFLYEWIIVIF